MAGESGGVLVGRDNELNWLRESLAGLIAGRGGVVWVEGEPGIGKSVLVDAAVAGVNGVRVFRAAADEMTQSFALRLAADCLGVAAGVDEFRAEIAGLLAGRGGVADAVSAAAEQLLALVDRECVRGPVVVVGDDLQWADEASLGVWFRLMAASAQQPLLLVGVCRPVPRRVELDRLRRAVAVHHDAVTLELAPLTPDQVAVMAHRLVSARPGPQLTGLLQQAAGNPLYVREMLDTLARDGLLRTEFGVAELASPVGGLPLAAAIGRRLTFLAEPVRTALRAAALLDSGFNVEDWALVAGRSVHQLTSVAAEAMAAGVLAETGTELMFRHPLIRQALHDELPAPLRTAIHAHAAQTLASAHRSWDRVARHLLAAPDAIDGWVLSWLADLPAAALYARPATAAQLLDAARHRSPVGGPQQAVFTTRLTTALRLLQRHDELIDVGTQALARITDPPLVGEIAWNLARAYMMAARAAEAAEFITGVLAGPDPGVPWRSRLRAMHARSLHWSDQDERAWEQAERAIAEGERDRDPISIGWALSTQMALSEGLDANDAALQIVVGDDPESVDLRLFLLTHRLIRLHRLDRADELKAELPRVIAEAERAGSPRHTQIVSYAAIFFGDQGDWDQALLYHNQIDTSGLDLVTHAETTALAAWITLCRGDRATAQQHLAAFDDTALAPVSGVARTRVDNLVWAKALLAEADGQVERAAAMLAEQLDREHPGFQDNDFLAQVVRLALAVGDRATAQTAAQIAEAGAQVNGESDHAWSAGLCRAMLDDDSDTLLAVADHLDRAGRRPFLAFVLQEAAVRLAGRGDLTSARAAFTKAAAIYDRLGSVLDLGRLQARLRPHGIRRGPRSAHRSAQLGWEALTPAEHRVAALVAQGDSNPDIAAQLFLSRRTVESHVYSIRHKLRARSRVEIANEVARRAPIVNTVGTAL